MLQGFLGHVVGIRYVEEQKHVKEVYYTDPGQLFLHGLIDTRQGTCGNMAALHVAMCRRLGWPVSLASARSHFLSRFDDGEAIHNVEATSMHAGSFASDPDEIYVERFNLPKRAIACGSDLRKLTAREMVAVFLALRGRHYHDTDRTRLADADFALSRVLFPNHRRTYVAAIEPIIRRGADLFEPDEVGHPDTLFEDLAPQFGFGPFGGLAAPMPTLVHNAIQPPRHRDVTSNPANNSDPTGLQVFPPNMGPGIVPVGPTPYPPTGQPWAPGDFLNHYFGLFPNLISPGAPVDLGNIGMLGQFRDAPDVQRATNEFDQMVREQALGKRFGLDCDKNRRTSFTFSDNTGTDVTNEIFVVGRSTFFRSATVTVTVSGCTCCEGKTYPTEYAWEATVNYAIKDMFKDPLKTGGLGATGELPGGTPYPITASWSIRLSGHGKIPTPCV